MSYIDNVKDCMKVDIEEAFEEVILDRDFIEEYIGEKNWELFLTVAVNRLAGYVG